MRSTVSLVLSDLDHFKQINNERGDLAGDHVLAEIAAVARENIRRELAPDGTPGRTARHGRRPTSRDIRCCGMLACMPPNASRTNAARPPQLPRRSKRILIAGCGYVGSRLARKLAADGCEVFTLRRGPSVVAPGIVSMCADLTRIETLGVLPEMLDAIVYSAGAGTADEAAYRAAYLDGVENVLRSVADSGDTLPRIVFCSSTAVYGQERGEWVDEETPARPRRWNGELLLAAERVLGARAADSIVVRLGGIYGPGRTRLVDSVRDGSARRRPDAHFTNRIHRDDAAGILAHLALADAPKHRCYLAVDDEPADEAEVLDFLADQLSVPKPGVARSDEAASRRAGSKRCRNARIRAEGYTFEFPSFRDGYARTLDGHTKMLGDS